MQQNYLVLDDLRVGGYKNLSRSEGLDFNQLKMCLRTLALWHSGSVKILDNVSIYAGVASNEGENVKWFNN